MHCSSARTLMLAAAASRWQLLPPAAGGAGPLTGLALVLDVPVCCVAAGRPSARAAAETPPRPQNAGRVHATAQTHLTQARSDTSLAALSAMARCCRGEASAAAPLRGLAGAAQVSLTQSWRCARSPPPTRTLRPTKNSSCSKPPELSSAATGGARWGTRGTRLRQNTARPVRGQGRERSVSCAAAHAYAPLAVALTRSCSSGVRSSPATRAQDEWRREEWRHRMRSCRQLPSSAVTRHCYRRPRA